MTVTVLLLVADERSDSSRVSVSSSIDLPMGTPDRARLVDVVTSRAREGAVRPGAQLAPQGALPDRRFVPLAAVVPAHVTH